MIKVSELLVSLPLEQKKAPDVPDQWFVGDRFMRPCRPCACTAHLISDHRDIRNLSSKHLLIGPLPKELTHTSSRLSVDVLVCPSPALASP
jgi:hypothetical protein